MTIGIRTSKPAITRTLGCSSTSAGSRIKNAPAASAKTTWTVNTQTKISPARGVFDSLSVIPKPPPACLTESTPPPHRVRARRVGCAAAAPVRRRHRRRREPGYAGSDTIYVSALNRADGEPATDEDANAYLINTNYRGQHSTVPVISDWKKLGFTPKYERYDGGTQAQKGPMTEEQKAERKTLIANNKAMESVHGQKNLGQGQDHREA